MIMNYLLLFMGIGSLGVVFSGVAFVRSYRELSERARQDKGCAMRNATLGPVERQRWNREFWAWRVIRVPLIVTLVEGFILALLFRIPDLVMQIWLFLALFQSISMGVLYISHIGLLFRFGRFHLERLDHRQVVIKRLAWFFFVLCAWLPLPAFWCYIRWVFVPPSF